MTISIVTYKTDPNVLRRALSSIVDSGLSVRTYVVDNSPDDRLAPLVDKYKSTYIHPQRNIGFGRGHNLALKAAGDSRYHVILNPDITFGPSVLPELFEFMEINPEIGWVMPKITYPDGSKQNLCKRLPNPWDLFTRRFLMSHGWLSNSKRQARFECSDLDLSIPRPIPYLSGCFAFVRTHLLRAVGGFDERFFLYLEDTDLVRRIGDLALTVYYPYTNVCHLYGRGSYQDQILLRHHVISAFRYFFKWGWFIDKRRKQINASLRLDSYELSMVDSAGGTSRERDGYLDKEDQPIALCTL